MLDLIRKGWRKVVRFIFGEKPSPDQDVVERPGQETLVDTYSTSPVSIGVEVSPDNDIADSTGTVTPVDTIAPSSVLTVDDTAPDQDFMECTGTGISADTPSTAPVPTAETVSPGNDIPDSTRTAPPVDTLPPSSVPADRTEPPYDFSRWTITEVQESPFEKCGRLSVEGEDLVIRSDLDTRGFRIPLRDIVAVLDGEPQPIRLLRKGKKVGLAKGSASGKAVNFIIDPYLYTVPLSRVMDVLEGRARKAAVFVGRDVTG